MMPIGKEQYEQDINDACKEVAKLLPNVLIRFQSPQDEELQFCLGGFWHFNALISFGNATNIVAIDAAVKIAVKPKLFA